MKTEISPVTEP